ncbi:hypothetical protein EVAR_57393_1 [Eumeta japonica]|uniref:Uncharacterized protein n=1 Tax=Eumeta variegata TaxID=151549 RepID=A0A4C1YBW5_EUMVA|nr:hypothetical protein EVAR_57393_1 [Eumeta japonica]
MLFGKPKATNKININRALTKSHRDTPLVLYVVVVSLRPFVAVEPKVTGFDPDHKSESTNDQMKRTAPFSRRLQSRCRCYGRQRPEVTPTCTEPVREA